MKSILFTLFISFISSSSVFPQEETIIKEPQALTSLRSKWVQAKEKALKPINKKYLMALQKLKEKHTKKGNLESAIAIDNEIKKMIISNGANDPKKTTVKKEYTAFNEELKIVVKDDRCLFTRKGKNETATVMFKKPFPNTPLNASIKRNYQNQGGSRKFGSPLQGEEVIFPSHYVVHLCSKAILIWNYKQQKFEAVLTDIK